MSLTFLDIQNWRNLVSVKVQPAAKFNLLYGDNGSGKTSFLEAIHYLAVGRSFRTRLNERITHHEASHFSLFSQIQQENHLLPVGIERHMNGEGRIRIDQENAKSLMRATQALPIRLLYADSRSLLTGSAKLRRQFIDWGTFHVEPTFLKHWQHAQRALKQRNAALRSQAPHSMLKLWDAELENASLILNPLRKKYTSAFTDVFAQVIHALLPTMAISLTYKAGWNEALGLSQVLEQSLSRDRELGYTQYGPQRADLAIRLNKTRPVQDELSQGQQKIVIYALYLAQGIFLRQQTGKRCVYLLDDLPAELDTQNRQRVMAMLHEVDAQVFITGVDREALLPLHYPQDTKLFHVEQGNIQEVAMSW